MLLLTSLLAPTMCLQMEPAAKQARTAGHGKAGEASTSQAGQGQPDQHSQEQGEVEVVEGPATQLVDLPDEALGIMWGFLDRQSRINLWRTCRAFRASKAINAAISSLSIDEDSPEVVVQQVVSFPRTACLRTLDISCASIEGALLQALCALLQSEAAVNTVKSVEGFMCDVGGVGWSAHALRAPTLLAAYQH